MKRVLFSIGAALLCAGMAGAEAADEDGAASPPAQRSVDAGMGGLRIHEQKVFSSLSLPLQRSADGGLETNTVQLLTSYARYLGLKTRGEPIPFARSLSGSSDGGLDLRIELAEPPADSTIAAPFSVHVLKEATEAEATCTVDFNELSNCIETVENSLEGAGYQQIADARVESLGVSGNAGRYRVTVFIVPVGDTGADGGVERMEVRP